MLRLNLASKNAILDSGINAVWNSGFLDFYSGGQPANASDAPPGVLLASITLPADIFTASSGGFVQKLGTWQDTSVDASGTPAWCRFRLSTDAGAASDNTNARMDLKVGAGTTLSALINAIVTTIGVADTTAFASSGTLVIEDETITYTGKTLTMFTGCVRGASGTTAAAHASGVTVLELGVEMGVDNTTWQAGATATVVAFSIGVVG